MRASRSMRSAASGAETAGRDDLQRDPALQHRVLREVDGAHAAAAELLEETVLRRAEVRPLRHAPQVRHGPVREPPHGDTPRRLRASSRNSRSFAVISRSFSRTIRRNSRRAKARKLVTWVTGMWNSSASRS